VKKGFDNWKVVVLSVIGATTFWFFNALNKDYSARISYPVDFEFERDSVIVMKPLPSTLDIDVSSGGWNLLRKTFWFNVDPIRISLENPTEIGFYTRNSLLPVVVDQLKELKINQLITDTVLIDIEKKMSKKVRLQLDSAQIDLAENHRVTSQILLSPDSVMMIVPQSFYDTLGNDYPLVLTSKGISGDYNREVVVKIPGRDLTRSIPESVRVKFTVDKFERRSVEVGIEIENFPEDSSIYLSQDKIQVFYTVNESLDTDFSGDDFVITTDLNLLDPKDSTVLAILVYHPEEALEIEVIPENIKVAIKDEQ
jgi:hypothetical protein